MKHTTATPIVLVAGMLLAAGSLTAAPNILQSPEAEFFEDFQLPSVPAGPSGLAWFQGETYPGFYVYIEGNEDAEGAPSNIVLSENAAHTGSTRLYSFAKESNFSPGLIVGSSSGKTGLALRLVNETGKTIRAIQISYVGMQWFDAAETPKSIKLGFHVGDPTSDLQEDVDAFLQGGNDIWEEILEGAFATPVVGNSGEVNPLAEGRREVHTPLEFLDWPNGEVLWLRWDFSGPPWGARLSIDDVRVQIKDVD